MFRDISKIYQIHIRYIQNIPQIFISIFRNAQGYIWNIFHTYFVNIWVSLKDNFDLTQNGFSGR